VNTAVKAVIGSSQRFPPSNLGRTLYGRSASVNGKKVGEIMESFYILVARSGTGGKWRTVGPNIELDSRAKYRRAG
jgi:hypothetical protein